MFIIKKCSNCNRTLKHKDKVTVVIPDVEIEGRYIKNGNGFRLKLSEDGVEFRTAKVYCVDCINIKNHFMGEE